MNGLAGTGSHRQGFQIVLWPKLTLATERVHVFSSEARFQAEAAHSSLFITLDHRLLKLDFVLCLSVSYSLGSIKSCSPSPQMKLIESDYLKCS